ncbi:formate dehydrogenase O subunit gamma [Klebsiella michiganensis]|nr:formate dehydrogenase O subunit gamma [Klebsiella michiganensis]
MLHSFSAVALIVVIMVHIYAGAVGEGHHYRDGGRLGHEDLGEETSPALVS